MRKRDTWSNFPVPSWDMTYVLLTLSGVGPMAGQRRNPAAGELGACTEWWGGALGPL